MCYIEFIAPDDYMATTAQVTFAPGETTQTVSVSTVTDVLIEGNEMFTAVLSMVDPNVVLDQDTATATILDNSGKLKAMCAIKNSIIDEHVLIFMHTNVHVNYTDKYYVEQWEI